MNIEDLELLVKPFRDFVSEGIEFPDPFIKLDMASRGNDKTRQFKHLHQMCSGHCMNFAHANQIKLVALADGYIANAKLKSSIGIYMFSRSILELAAFQHDVTERLTKIAAKPEEDWRPKGEQFFGVIVRARYGTSNPEISKSLKDAGAAKKHLDPINVMESLRKLFGSKIGRELKGEYDVLCDYVHHNLSSNYTSSPGSREGDVAFSGGGGRFHTKQMGSITRYEYPVPIKAEEAKNETIQSVKKSLEIFVKSINAMPHTPYSDEQIEKITGTKFGFVELS